MPGGDIKRGAVNALLTLLSLLHFFRKLFFPNEGILAFSPHQRRQLG